MNSHKDIMPIVGNVPDAQVMSDLDAAEAFAITIGGDESRVGVTGFRWAGHIVWLYAAHNKNLQAGVTWFGRLAAESTELRSKNPIDLVKGLQAPVLDTSKIRDW
jgi:carboxymethylenebutenolidase